MERRFLNFYCNNTWKSIVKNLKSDIRIGLTDEEVELRRKEFGDNSITLSNFEFSPENILKEGLSLYLVWIIILSFYFLHNKQMLLFGIIGVMVLINIWLRISRVKKRIREIDFIDNLNVTTVTVLRNGRERVIKNKELVIGDIVYFSKGSLISADLRVIKCYDLKVSEINVTGEKFLKEKFESKISMKVSSLSEMGNMLFRGSLIKEGEGCGIVVALGKYTYLGQVLNNVDDNFNEKNTLYKKVDKILFKYIFLLSLIGMMKPLTLFVIVAFPYEGLVTLYLLFLKYHYKKRGIEIYNNSVYLLIEDIEVFFTDKIGVVTEEAMEVAQFLTNNEILQRDFNKKSRNINVERLLDILLITNNSFYDNVHKKGRGELTEIAVLKYCEKLNIQKNLIDGRNRRIFDIPMDSDKRFYSTLNKNKRGYRCNTRGDVDSILDSCTHIMIAGVEKEITSEDKDLLKKANYLFSLKGLITEGVAYRSFNYKPTIYENVESNLVFVGMVAFENPLIENMDTCILKLKEENVVPMLFTEDNKIVSSAIGIEAKFIGDRSNVISGAELSYITKEESLEVLSKAKVFNRVDSYLRANIIKLFKENKYGVMTMGENLGDLFSLATSKVGISRNNAPEIIRKVSDIHINYNYLENIIYLLDKSKKFSYDIEELLRWELYYLALVMAALIGVMAMKIEVQASHLIIVFIINLIFTIVNLCFHIRSFGNNE